MYDKSLRTLAMGWNAARSGQSVLFVNLEQSGGRRDSGWWSAKTIATLDPAALARPREGVIPPLALPTEPVMVDARLADAACMPLTHASTLTLALASTTRSL